jgi:hypothetical protein
MKFLQNDGSTCIVAIVCYSVAMKDVMPISIMRSRSYRTLLNEKVAVGSPERLLAAAA